MPVGVVVPASEHSSKTRLGRAGLIQAAVLLLVVVTTATPLDEWIQDLVFRYVVGHEGRLLSNGVTELGTSEVGAALLGGLGVLAYWTADPALWRTSLGGLAGLAVGGGAAQLLKHATCRARPRLVEGWGVGDPEPPDRPDRRGFFHWPCFARWRYHSFPSGHANTAFTVAAALSAAVPGRRWLWLAVAGGVGFSRVILNAHFVGDVVAGGLLGWWGGQVGLAIADRWLPALPGRRGRPLRPDLPDQPDEPDRAPDGLRSSTAGPAAPEAVAVTREISP
jgi:membrane-associated phospholipid phosphatase